MPKLATHIVRILAVPVLLAGVAAWAAPAAPAAARARSQHVAASVPFTGYFNGVAATSATNAWAVGVAASAYGDPHIEHWNGTAWKWMPAPGLYSDGDLTGVAATSASNAWAVGFAGNLTLIARWNGTTWKQVPSPSPGPGENALYGVAATSASNAWAVGTTVNARGTLLTFILRWNGTTWTRVPSPSPGPFNNLLYGVAATTASNAWAAGWTETAAGHVTTLIEHWNGTTWTRVPSPNPGSEGSTLYGVAATSASNAWAVGTTSDGINGEKTLTLQWNGTTWTTVPSPNGPLLINGLSGVAATSATDAWAIGGNGGNGESNTLILHWNGITWKTVPSPSPGNDAAINSVTATSTSNAWAVGTFNLQGDVWILRWNGTAWKAVPSAPAPP
jgi:hypothetical protein